MTNQDFCPTKSRCYRWRQIVWLCPSAANEQPHFSLQIDGVGVSLHLWTRGDKDDVSEKHRHVYVISSRSPNFAIDGSVVNSQFWPRGRKRRHLFKYAKKSTLAIREWRRANATLAVGRTGKFTIRQFYIFYTRPKSHDFDLLLKVFQMPNSKTDQGNTIQLVTIDLDKCHTWFTYIHHI